MVIRFASALAVVATLTITPAFAQAPARRLMVLADLDRARDVRDPQISPDGRWVAYTVVLADTEKDRDNADVWMSSWDGAEHLQLTSSPDRESQPRWSPDGKWLAFLSARAQGEDDKPSGAQVWLMSRQGGEARRLTDRKGGVSDLAWSPDSTRLVLVGNDPDPEDDEAEGAKKSKTKKPLVIDRYHFKQDGDGYLLRRYSHLYLLTIATKGIEPLTKGEFDDQLPAWSPDGTRLGLREQARSRPRSHQRHQHLRHGREARCRGASADDVERAGSRVATGLEPGRIARGLSTGQRASALCLQPQPARGRERVGRRATHAAHRLAGSRGRITGVVARRHGAVLRRRGRPRRVIWRASRPGAVRSNASSPGVAWSGR